MANAPNYMANIKKNSKKECSFKNNWCTWAPIITGILMFTQLCLFSMFRQSIFSCPVRAVFFVAPRITLFLVMPEPVQQTALFWGGVAFLESSCLPLFLVWLCFATLSIHGLLYCSDLISPGFITKCRNWSFVWNPASYPLSLCIIVAQAVTEMQNCIILLFLFSLEWVCPAAYY